LHPDHEINRASWDELAAAHGQDAYYDSEALVAGAGPLMEEDEAALARARSLAERCGVEVEWICADVTQLPESLDDRFDLVWRPSGCSAGSPTSARGCARLRGRSRRAAT
jgi:hypothetical protein